MNSSDRTRGDPLGSPAEAATMVPSMAPPLAGSEEYGSWLDRMQRARTRHAAITRNLHTWTNYKSWTDQVKGTWEPEPDSKRK
ncbi:MAG: hypothetical protein WDM77_09315 [Steroidobacteraceae bacterium]